MENGQIFTIDRWRDGKVKEYKCIRLCLKWISVKSVDGTEKWAMPYHRLMDIDPPQTRFSDDLLTRATTI